MSSHMIRMSRHLKGGQCPLLVLLRLSVLSQSSQLDYQMMRCVSVCVYVCNNNCVFCMYIVQVCLYNCVLCMSVCVGTMLVCA